LAGQQELHHDTTDDAPLEGSVSQGPANVEQEESEPLALEALASIDWSDQCSAGARPKGRVADKADKVEFVRNFLAHMKVKHNVSHTAIAGFYEFFCLQNHELIHQLGSEQAFPSIKTLRRQIKADLPTIHLKYVCQMSEGQKTNVITVEDVSSLPEHLRVDRMSLLRVCGYISIKDIFDFMVQVCAVD